MGIFSLFARVKNLSLWLRDQGKKPLILATFVTAILLVAAVFATKLKISSGAVSRGILGGPIDAAAAVQEDSLLGSSALGKELALVSLSGGLVLPGGDAAGEIDSTGALHDFGQPIGQVFSRENFLIYKVQKGDTISGIAAYFGISLDTIANANPTIRARFLKPGDELNILPTSGVVYQTRGGDTLESIADYFNIQPEKITQFNKSINFGTLGAGISIVIPGGKAGLASARNNSLPNFNGNFIRPSDGFNWGILHHYNAVDIANSCGVPVVAAAEGLVVPDDSFGDGRSGWNGGYGQFVLIEHPFGDAVRTRYAHLSKIEVGIGDYVRQGQEIGIMGDTGDATGCHVHFEVYGAENPFAK